MLLALFSRSESHKIQAAVVCLLRLCISTTTSTLKVNQGVSWEAPRLPGKTSSDKRNLGIAVSSTGCKFSNYARSLDPNNIRCTTAELTANNTETPYPSLEMNSPPGGAINYTTTPATGANYEKYLIDVQSVVIDPKDRLWILDTGRAAMQNGTNVPASVGGPKLIRVNLQNDIISETIVFPPNVAFAIP